MNSADRVIRVFDMDGIMMAEREEDMEPMQKMQDLVNRLAGPGGCGLAIQLLTFDLSPPSERSGESAHSQVTVSSLWLALIVSTSSTSGTRPLALSLKC